MDRAARELAEKAAKEVRRLILIARVWIRERHVKWWHGQNDAALGGEIPRLTAPLTGP